MTIEIPEATLQIFRDAKMLSHEIARIKTSAKSLEVVEEVATNLQLFKSVKFPDNTIVDIATKCANKEDVAKYVDAAKLIVDAKAALQSAHQVVSNLMDALQAQSAEPQGAAVVEKVRENAVE